MSEPASTPRPLALGLAIFAGLVLMLGVAGHAQYFATPIVESGDIAVNALQVDNARHFRELYGNYSRFEFNHPGPAFFYVYAAGELLFHDLLRIAPLPANAELLTGLCLQAGFFALALALLSTLVPARSFVPLALLAAAVHFGMQREPFVSLWPPHVLLFPFLCFLAAAVSVALGRIGHLWAAVLAGGFLFHGHVAQPIFVGGLGALMLALAAWRLRQEAPAAGWRERLAPHRGGLRTCAILVAIFLLPLAIDVIARGREGNVATILGRFYANTGDSKTLAQSLLYFDSFATPARNQDELFTTLGPQVSAFHTAHLGRLAAWAAVFFFPPGLVYLWRRRLGPLERRFFGIAYAFLAAAVAGCLAWGTAQAGEMAHFNGYFYYAVYYFALLLGLALLARAIDRIAPRPVLAACCAAAAVIASWGFRLPRLQGDEATGMSLLKGTALAMKGAPGRPRLLVFEHAQWPEAAGVALQLQRAGAEFYVTPWWEFMFGSRHDARRLGEEPEEAATVWWIAPAGGGVPINARLDLFTEPGTIRPGLDAIEFRGGANAFRHVVSGLTVGNGENAATNERELVLLLAPAPATRDVRLVFDARAKPAEAAPAGGQPGEVYFNGQHVGSLVAGARADLAVTVPAALWNSQPRAKLELRLPQAVRNHSYKRPRYEWWSAWELWSIRFEAAT